MVSISLSFISTSPSKLNANFLWDRSQMALSVCPSEGSLSLVIVWTLSWGGDSWCLARSFKHLDHLTLQTQTSLGRGGCGGGGREGASLPELPPTVCFQVSSVLLVLAVSGRELTAVRLGIRSKEGRGASVLME